MGAVGTTDVSRNGRRPGMWGGVGGAQMDPIEAPGVADPSGCIEKKDVRDRNRRRWRRAPPAAAAAGGGALRAKMGVIGTAEEARSAEQPGKEAVAIETADVAYPAD